jgi:hypothetical protein
VQRMPGDREPSEARRQACDCVIESMRAPCRRRSGVNKKLDAASISLMPGRKCALAGPSLSQRKPSGSEERDSPVCPGLCCEDHEQGRASHARLARIVACNQRRCAPLQEC